MKDIKDMEYCKDAETLSQILTAKTQNTDPLFFRILTSYYLTKITSMMRINILTHDRGLIPVSAYAINLAGSGVG